jgi:hypothetical protein
MLEANIHGDNVLAFYHGRTVMGTSAAVMTSVNLPDAVKGVQLKAGPSNTGIIYVGNVGVTAGSAVSTDGMPLSAGEGLFIPVKDITLIYAIASAATQDLYWFVV